MRVIIQVRSGAHQGRRYSLSPGQQLQVGRTDASDVSFQDDQQLSSIHFQLVVDQASCRIRDLDSANGLFVNHEAVSLAILHTGDRVTAGNTEFIVFVEGGPQSEANDMVPIQQTKFSNTVAIPELSPWPGSFSLQQCKTNLYCWRGTADARLPQLVASALSRKNSPVLSLNRSKLDPAYQQCMGPVQPLHDWLHDEAQAENPHVLVTSADQMGDFGVLMNAWGKDAVIAIYYPPAKPVPLAQIRRFAGVYCRPSVARMSLANTTEDQVNLFLQGIDAVFMEDEDPASWVLYSRHDLSELLTGTGFIESTSPRLAG